jgi:hypothetical protein
MSPAPCIVITAFTLLLSVTSSASAATGKPTSQETVVVRVRVYNYAGVPADTLARAENEIARIFGKAGLGLEWTACPTSDTELERQPSCQERMSPLELGLTILSRKTAPKGTVRKGHLGYSEVFSNGQVGHYAYVYYDALLSPVYRAQLAPSQALALVTAHEFGHLLICSGEHFPVGLMRSNWDNRDLGDAASGQLLFTDSQAKQIRVGASARANIK